MRNQPHRRIRNSATGIVALLVLAAVAGGCGGGGSDSSSDALRKKLQEGAAKIEDAKSFRASIGFEVEEEGESEEIGCLDLSVDSGKPESFDLLFFDLNCDGGSEAHEVIAVGHRAWGSRGQDGEHWQEAKISPAVLHEVGDEQTELSQLFKVAEDIEEHPEDGAVEEGKNGDFVDVASYTFEAPASAFPDSSDEISDTQVEFEAVLDRKGFLRELILHGDEEGTGATVTETYEDIDQDLGIGAPDPSKVHGRLLTIRSREDFEQLFGLPTS